MARLLTVSPICTVYGSQSSGGSGHSASVRLAISSADSVTAGGGVADGPKSGVFSISGAMSVAVGVAVKTATELSPVATTVLAFPDVSSVGIVSGVLCAIGCQSSFCARKTAKPTSPIKKRKARKPPTAVGSPRTRSSGPLMRPSCHG